MPKKYWFTLIGLLIIQAIPQALLAAQVSEAPGPSPVAEVAQRVGTHGLQVHVCQGKQIIELTHFVELLVVTPRGAPRTIEDLVKRSVAIVPSKKKPDRLEVYQDIWAGAGKELDLPDNVFKVKQVFISSRQSPIELRLDGQIVRLKAGDALLVL